MNPIEVYGSELGLITTHHVAHSAVAMLRAAPAKSWTMPASSSSKYHAVDECVTGGNVLHTKRVVAMVVMLAPAYGLDRWQLDIVIAAALIHDILKQGPEDNMCSKAEYNMHGPNLWLWYEACLGMPDSLDGDILDMASRHMGVWSAPSYRPNDSCSNCLAMADYVASRKPIGPNTMDNIDTEQWLSIRYPEQMSKADIADAYTAAVAAADQLQEAMERPYKPHDAADRLDRQHARTIKHLGRIRQNMPGVHYKADKQCKWLRKDGLKLKTMWLPVPELAPTEIESYLSRAFTYAFNDVLADSIWVEQPLDQAFGNATLAAVASATQSKEV
jgi:hypothetical protein